MRHVVLVALLILCTCCSESMGDSNDVITGFDAKAMLTSLASNIMSRGYAVTANGGSQVVSLNLTNLLVLVLLKALIFAAGSLGAGTWKGGYARSADGAEELLSEEEIVMYLSYLAGSPGRNGCLQNIACREPEQAERYSTAGEMLLKAGRMLHNAQGSMPYEYTLQEMKEAIVYGLAGGDCTSRYYCGSVKEARRK